MAKIAPTNCIVLPYGAEASQYAFVHMVLSRKAAYFLIEPINEAAGSVYGRVAGAA